MFTVCTEENSRRQNRICREISRRRIAIEAVYPITDLADLRLRVRVELEAKLFQQLGVCRKALLDCAKNSFAPEIRLTLVCCSTYRTVFFLVSNFCIKSAADL